MATNSRQKEDKIRQIGNLFKRARKNPNEGRVYDPRGLAPALSCMGGGNRMPFIIELQEHRSKGLKRCKNLEWMLERGIVPISHAVWVDAYNKICAKVAGTISTRTDPSNQRFVTELYENDCDIRPPEEPQETAPDGEVLQHVAGNGIQVVAVGHYCLRWERTEEQKQIRRLLGDNGGVRFQSKRPALREDGCSNTISTIEKDNLIFEVREHARIQ